jgi:hypothetical protein
MGEGYRGRRFRHWFEPVTADHEVAPGDHRYSDHSPERDKYYPEFLK